MFKRKPEAGIPLLCAATLILLLLFGAAPQTLTASDGEAYAVTVTYDAPP